MNAPRLRDQTAAFDESAGNHSHSFPTAVTPSISEARVYAPNARIAVFGDDYWPLAALDNDSTRIRRTLSFADWPNGFRDFGKHVAYALINSGTPIALLEQEGGRYVPWPSPGSIHKALGQLRVAVSYLAGPWSERHPDTTVFRSADLDSHHLDDLKRWIDTQEWQAKARNDTLEVIVRVWYLTPSLPSAEQWPEPAWLLDDWKIRRPAKENKTKRISQSTLGPLLEWATAFVTLFADDILGARQHYSDRIESLPSVKDGYADSLLACRAVLDDYAQSGRPLPGDPRMAGGTREREVCWTALAYRHGLPGAIFGHAFQRLDRSDFVVNRDPSLTAVDFPIAAEFHRRPWAPYIGVYDLHPIGGGKDQLAPLVAHLRTACIIVSAYLTGARPEEVVGWEHGAAPGPILAPGGAQLHLIHGRVWKGVNRGIDGTPGTPRDAAWATIAPAATAIRVSEAINEAHGRTSGLLYTNTGNVLLQATIGHSIEDFIAFVNARLAPHTSNPAAFAIPADPDGFVTLSRFRRTLAWFIRNRRGGEVTVALQYQHLETVLGGGYAGTKESGLNDLLLEEDWAHRKSTIGHLADLLDTGQGISGPAADRAVASVRALPRHLTPGDERRLRKDRALAVYDNPSALALCVYFEPTALCQKVKRLGIGTQPNLLDCVEGCPNCARTDEHLVQLQGNADRLRNHAALAPKPLAQSLHAEADRIQGVSRDFGGTRISQPGSVVDGKLGETK